MGWGGRGGAKWGQSIGMRAVRPEAEEMGAEMVELGEDDLIRWGERIGRELKAPLVLSLRGDLGAGKTTLARAIARGAGVEGSIPSPTYNLLFRYPASGGREVVHIDLYRIEDAGEVWALGWEELPGPSELVMIEWGERAEGLLPTPRWEVFLEEGQASDSRIVRLEGVGDPPPITEPEGRDDG